MRDRADSATTLYLKVRCSPLAFEPSVLAIVYDDAAHADRDASAEREDVATLARDDRPTAQARAPRHTLVFERIVGRDAAAPLLGVGQITAIGEHDARRTVRARWDALDDYTLLVREAGAARAAPAVTIGMRTPVSTTAVTTTRSDDPNQEGGARRSDPERPKPCGPTVVSETDVRGRVVLHVASDDG